MIEKYELGKKTWTYKGFHGILHTFFPVGECALKKMKEFYGESFNLTLFFVTEDYVHWYWDDEDMIKLRESIIKKVEQDSGFLGYMVEEWENALRKFDEVIKKVKNLDKLSDEELFSLYKEFYDAYITEFGIAIGYQDAFSMHADNFLKPLLKKYVKKDLEKYYALLTTPVTESFITKEYKERMKLKTDEDYENHAKKWFWIENNYAKFKPLTAEDFKKKGKKKVKEIKLDKEKIIKELKLGNEFKNLIKIAETFAYMQDDRKKYVLISNYYQNLFMKEIGRRKNYTEKEMHYTVFPEIENLPDKKTLEERYKHCVCIQTLEGYEILYGKKADEVYQKFFAPKLETKEIKGSCASPGKVRGIVRIVRKTHDLINFDKGDILVASMTRPEMVTAIEKAAAIVTDEGGITCHAAIVSRELGIPCILATHTATKVLKDGDLIEVDADNGIVRIL